VENLGLERLKPNLAEEEVEEEVEDQEDQEVRVVVVRVEEGLVEEEGVVVRVEAQERSKVNYRGVCFLI
jgi:hypothetical protein|tara:strand:+ start:828 stop:1034 length:207 start_codon:yes stop_codon:yes gene_type:complete